jgi:plastocyanin
MVDKCPKCGETLITRTIQKKLGLGSIDIPVAEICPKCNWNRDLTGAGDIVAKPLSPEAEALEKTRPSPSASKQRVPDMNKVITIALAFLVIAGIAWAFMPKGNEPTGSIQPTPTTRPEVAASATVTAIPPPQVAYTGKNITVKIDRDRGFYAPAQSNLKIKAGDGVVWVNVGTYSLTLISKDSLFEDKVMDNDKRATYIFKNTGTFTFDIVVMGVKKFSGTVTVEP